MREQRVLGLRIAGVVGVVVGALLMGCGGAATEVPATSTAASAGRGAPRDEAAAGGWIAAPPATAWRPEARTLLGGGAVTIGEPAPPPEPTRPRKRGRVAIHLQKADLENALRLLAEAGGFNLVVQSGLSGSVSTALEGVDAYDALVAIAEANGAEVRYERGIVIVRRPEK